MKYIFAPLLIVIALATYAQGDTLLVDTTTTPSVEGTVPYGTIINKQGIAMGSLDTATGHIIDLNDDHILTFAANGQVLDANSDVVGQIANGQIKDMNQHLLGTIDVNGVVADNNGHILGSVTGKGKVLNSNGHQIGECKDVTDRGCVAWRFFFMQQ